MGYMNAPTCAQTSTFAKKMNQGRRDLTMKVEPDLVVLQVNFSFSCIQLFFHGAFESAHRKFRQFFLFLDLLSMAQASSS